MLLPLRVVEMTVVTQGGADLHECNDPATDVTTTANSANSDYATTTTISTVNAKQADAMEHQAKPSIKILRSC